MMGGKNQYLQSSRVIIKKNCKFVYKQRQIKVNSYTHGRLCVFYLLHTINGWFGEQFHEKFEGVFWPSY